MSKNTKHFIVKNGERVSFMRAILEIANAGAYYSSLTRIKKGVFSGPQAAYDWHVAKRSKPKLTASQSLLARYAKERLKIIEHYTKGKMACVQCGESRFRALCIDHVNADGNIFRKKRTSQQEWRKIIEGGFPDSYQILCHNCNICKYYEIDRALKAKRS